MGDAIEIPLAVDAEVRALGEPPANQPVEILVDGALPRLSGQSKIGPPVGPDNRYYILPIDAIS